MDRQHRRELKHDRFVDEVGLMTGRARANQRGLLGIALGAIAIAVIAYGVYFYRGNEERKAQAALAAAIETMESPLIDPNAPTANKDARYKTEVERTAAADKQFQAVQSGWSGTNAADVAGLYLARISSARGDGATARKHLQKFIDNHPRHLLVGGARYSLYQMRIGDGDAQQVTTELNAELGKQEPVLPPDAMLVLLAQAYEVQGSTEKSRDTYRRIVTEFPESPFVLEAQRRVGPA